MIKTRKLLKYLHFALYEFLRFQTSISEILIMNWEHNCPRLEEKINESRHQPHAYKPTGGHLRATKKVLR